jgi:RNA polymerase primary sigma factor
VERALGRQWVAGRQAEAHLRALRDAGGPSPQGVSAQLQAQARAGQQARARLIMACTPLVEGLARQYSGYNIPYEDLVQEGWVGVVRAAATFDPAKGPYFSRHAAWGARKAILDALTRRSRLIRLPAGVVDAIHHISAARHQWEQTAVDPPSVADLVQMTGLALARVQQVLGVMDPPLSLDAPGGPAAVSLGMTVGDDSPISLETAGARAVQRQELRTALAALDPLAQQVLACRYGLIDGTPYSTAEAGVLLRLPEAAVCRIETAALTTLRNQAVRLRPPM